jgi:hypothetical protein
VALKDVQPCNNSSAIDISKDGSKVFAWGSFGLRIADAKGTLLGSYPTTGKPLFAPNTARFAVLVDKDLQIIELASSQVLYHATLPAEQHTLSWVDDNRFIYDDAKTVYLVQL